jgi:hypothetical protein
MNDEFSKSEMMGNIVCKLIFLSKINEGEKINVKSMSITDNSMYANVYRYLFTSESKDTTYEFIKNTIDNAFSVLTLNENKYLTDTIIKSIIDAKNGILKLQQTYSLDRMFVSKLETLLKLIDIRLSKTEKLTGRSYFVSELKRNEE